MSSVTYQTDRIRELEGEVKALHAKVAELSQQNAALTQSNTHRTENSHAYFQETAILKQQNQALRAEVADLNACVCKTCNSTLRKCSKHQNPRGGGMKKAILVDKKVVLEPDLMKWGTWFETNREKRLVAKTTVGDQKVSTVFLGMDHSWDGDKPLWFETMIFGGPLDSDYQTRCETWEEAEKMHEEAVKIAETKV